MVQFIKHEGLKTIIELDEPSAKQWRKTIGKIRSNTIKKPDDYVSEYFFTKKLSENNLKNVSELISNIREHTWKSYITHEIEFYKQAVNSLANDNAIAKEIFLSLINQEQIIKLNINDKNQLYHELSEFFGDYIARIFPYFYELSKSVTQSRRSRAGSTFESIVSNLMKQYNYPYESQSKMGKARFNNEGLGKLVDGIVPGLKSYERDRSKCLILTQKTTLRERWQEVVEELSRTSIPSIYLLTLDDSLTANGLNIMKNHNITIVSYKSVKEKFKEFTNIISFETLFNEEIPHTLNWWNKRYDTNY